MRRHLRLVRETLALLTVLGSLGPAAPLAAQPQASQHGTVSQTVNTTLITLEYDRPVLRGRAVFGDILDHDAVWTPGAERVRVAVTPGTASHMEVLAFNFPVAGPYETTLRFHWREVVVPLRIEVSR